MVRRITNEIWGAKASSLLFSFITRFNPGQEAFIASKPQALQPLNKFHKSLTVILNFTGYFAA